MPGPESGTATAVYLFALTDGAVAAERLTIAVGPLPPPFLHRAGPVAAIVSLVSAAEYCGPEAAQRAAEITWLTPRVLQHAAVLREAMSGSAVFPVPFGTLYADLARLSAFLTTQCETLRRFFHHVADREEWTVTATARLGAVAVLETAAREAFPDWLALTPGARYMRLCRERPALIALARQRLHAIAGRLDEALAPLATAVRVLGCPGIAGSEEIGKFALLVPRPQAGRLHARISELNTDLARDGVLLSLSGPWPPFSFRPDLAEAPLATVWSAPKGDVPSPPGRRRRTDPGGGARLTPTGPRDVSRLFRASS